MNGLPALDAPLIPVPVSAEFTGDEPFMMSGAPPTLFRQVRIVSSTLFRCVWPTLGGQVEP